MAKIYPKVFMGKEIISFEDANLSIASSAVLYGLSVYTVFPIIKKSNGFFVFRIEDHFQRLINSAKIIGIDTFEDEWSLKSFKNAVSDLVVNNTIDEEMVFVRTTVHVDSLVSGTRSRGLKTTLSLFLYEAVPIVPQDGARLKTSVWRRVPDFAIPSRAKVNGAYVNSVLGKQDALDSGYDDCLFLDLHGHICELSAANIFLVKNNILITPGRSSDILEGINRATILEVAHELGLETEEREIDLTELYIADEVFACGTSAFVAPIIEIDGRKIITKKEPQITKKIQEAMKSVMSEGGFGKRTYLSKIEDKR